MVALVQELAMRTLSGPLRGRFGILAVAARLILHALLLAGPSGVYRAALVADHPGQRRILGVALDVPLQVGIGQPSQDGRSFRVVPASR
jgi:hypothetical protein